MSYHFKEPLPEGYDTDDEYQDAHKLWEWTEEQWSKENIDKQ